MPSAISPFVGFPAAASAGVTIISFMKSLIFMILILA
jgi:hypothetical protein